MRGRKSILVIVALLVPALLPGQTGYPRSRRNTSRSPGNLEAYKNLAATFHGALKDLTGKEIVIENEEHQLVSIRRTRKTKFLKDEHEIKASQIDLGTAVTVEAAEDIDLKPMAITVTVDSPAKKGS